MPLLRCPICEKQFDPATSPAMPFCSERCRQIDLGRWLREVYSVPIQRDPDDQREGEAPVEPN
jgi:endogenous inhibitor of DNA gyrase (YacG/DUF329 family)